jgi:hypothetical protein
MAIGKWPELANGQNWRKCSQRSCRRFALMIADQKRKSMTTKRGQANSRRAEAEVRVVALHGSDAGPKF